MLIDFAYLKREFFSQKIIFLTNLNIRQQWKYSVSITLQKMNILICKDLKLFHIKKICIINFGKQMFWLLQIKYPKIYYQIRIKIFLIKTTTKSIRPFIKCKF